MGGVGAILIPGLDMTWVCSDIETGGYKNSPGVVARRILEVKRDWKIEEDVNLYGSLRILKEC